MRMRKKKNTDERIQACAGYMYRNGVSERKNLHLEIGCGKGNFICATAQKFPEINFTAVEKIPDVIVSAIEKAKSLNLPNIKFLIADAKNLAEYFSKDSIDTLYLNFSDPWHKRYQHNNRLTSPAFLEIYKKIMKPNAKIIFKTDNTELFDYSIKNMPVHNFEIIRKTYDLYNSEFFVGGDNIQSEYEKKFAEQNIKICYLEAVNKT